MTGEVDVGGVTAVEADLGVLVGEEVGDGPEVGFAAGDGVERVVRVVVDLEVFGEEAGFRRYVKDAG